MQYVQVEFRPGDRRTYTYHNDGEPYAVGDRVRVDARGEEKTVTIVGISTGKPPFETKPILGPAPAPDPSADGDNTQPVPDESIPFGSDE